jgi:hypothetical protein
MAAAKDIVHLPIPHLHLPIPHPHEWKDIGPEWMTAARGADPRDATRPLTIDQAANGLRGLARLHSRFWGERGVRERALDWLAPYKLWPGLAPAIPISLERLGGTPAAIEELA